MAYVDLTEVQKTELQDWLTTILRPWCGEQARANNHGAAADTAYNSHISAILADLGGADEIPNEGGLVGATALTKDEVVSIVSHLQGILTNYNTAGHRTLWSQAAGAVNLIG
jgi:hypothetical protein